MEEKIVDDVLIQIFSYLKVADVRSCRQVCRRWYLCCNKRKITRAEKFVFRSAIDLTFEINEFLLNLERRVNVKLIGIDLRQLNFELFGNNIEELELKDCIVDVDTFKNLFYATPNMTRLRLSTHTVVALDSWYKSPPVWSDVEVWVKGVNLLHEEKFQNFNMKEFTCNIKDKETADSLGFRFSHFLFLFPCIRSISLSNNFSFDNIADLMNILPKTNITHLGGILHMRFDWIDESETFTSFSRLKILKVNIGFVRSSSYLSLCERFFSQMTELEELNCQLFTHVYAVQNSRNADPGKVAKVVLYHILRSCPKLTKISFLTNDYRTQIRLNRDELQEFLFLITKIKKLRLPRIVAESNSGDPMVAQANYTDDLLKDLDFDEAEFCEPSDVRYIIMETYQLTTLRLFIDKESSCMNVEKILQSQNYLQRLEVTINMDNLSAMEVLQMNSQEVIPLKHERLNHLVYVFHSPRPSDPIDYFIKRLCSCEFPNLRTVEVFSGCHEYNHSFKTATPELKILFKKWLGSMSTLIQIDVRLHLDLLNLHDCVEVCGQMPHLQKIRWTSPDIKEHNPQEEVVNLFVHLPNLRSMNCGYENSGSEGHTYKYSRCRKKLYQRSSREANKSYDLISVN